MLLGVDRILIRVESLSAAVRYYRDVMGLKPLQQSKHFVSFGLPRDKGELVIHDDPDQPAEAVYWLVESVRDLYQRRDALKLTFLGPPQSVARGFKAAVKDPFGIVLLLIDRSIDATVPEDAKPATGLFAGVEPRLAPNRELLARLYESLGRTADDLPYTPHFESLYLPYAQAHPDPKPSRSETWRHLLNLRKAGKLPKLGEAKSRPPSVTPEELSLLRSLLGPELGKRDRLPYTPRFDEIVDTFNNALPRKLSPHLVWRLVATMAK